ncbi:DUF3592 domain-containing protein [Hydrogenophaga sp. PAMC20947]|uniref:DUF3592 domain-containing protein n=1 Tax=Hydrogenophaga sp. PAMC20947 TaxID=2565558 RepID=UPI00109D8EF4|nr:DUF3592 domain-containing protein [Hydrogenophaga sp. PAMC20947]QCB45873.1 DUF3592 domain-containing protein [Hydrogenophaga sp. PAMC20947]
MQAVWGYVQSMWQQAWQGDVQAILFWVAVYCGVVGIYSLAFQLRIRRWPAAPGVLAQAGVERWGGPEWVRSDQQYSLKSAYRYRVDGRVYEGHRVSTWVMVASHNGRFLLEAQLKGVQRHPDGTVSVFYNPKRPHKSFLIQPGRVGLLITWVIILGPALFYWSRFHGG